MSKDEITQKDDQLLYHPLLTAAGLGSIIGIMASILFSIALLLLSWFLSRFINHPIIQQNTLLAWTLLGIGMFTFGLIEIIFQFNLDVDKALFYCALGGLNKLGFAIPIIIGELFGKKSQMKILKILIYGFSFLISASIIPIILTVTTTKLSTFSLYTYIFFSCLIFLFSWSFALVEEGHGNFGLLSLFGSLIIFSVILIIPATTILAYFCFIFI